MVELMVLTAPLPVECKQTPALGVLRLILHLHYSLQQIRIMIMSNDS